MFKKVTKEMKELIDYAIRTFGDESDILHEGLKQILGDSLKALKVLKQELFFDRYQDVYSYLTLAREIAFDDVTWEGDDSKERIWYYTVETEEEAKEKLMADGWRIAENGLAIGLDDSLIGA
jgi:hypothetical protein